MCVALLTLVCAGNLFVVQYLSAGKVRRVAAQSRAMTTVAGGGSNAATDGISATAASLVTPWGLSGDSLGSLYVGESVFSAALLLQFVCAGFV